MWESGVRKRLMKMSWRKGSFSEAVAKGWREKCPRLLHWRWLENTSSLFITLLNAFTSSSSSSSFSSSSSSSSSFHKVLVGIDMSSGIWGGQFITTYLRTLGNAVLKTLGNMFVHFGHSLSCFKFCRRLLRMYGYSSKKRLPWRVPLEWDKKAPSCLRKEKNIHQGKEDWKSPFTDLIKFGGKGISGVLEGEEGISYVHANFGSSVHPSLPPNFSIRMDEGHPERKRGKKNLNLLGLLRRWWVHGRGDNG